MTLNMTKLDYGRSRKLTVLMHADIAGSTSMVQQDEVAAHERIKGVFRRFSQVIISYQGRVREIRGDALVAQFERASDAVAATLSFQQSQVRHDEKLGGNHLQLRVGIALGEVVIDNHIITGSGVVLAQRVEQLAAPNGLCITAAIHEVLPKRMPFDQENLGDVELKGFDELTRVYRVVVRPGESIPAPQRIAKLTHIPIVNQTLKLAFVFAVVMVSMAAAGIGYEQFKQPIQTDAHWIVPVIEAVRKNPVKVTTESLELGASVYRKNCASCHGANADGKGLASNKLASKTVDLHMMSKSHSDGEFAYKIRVGRGAMPGWEDVLDETEIWSLVNYINSIHELYSETPDVFETHRNSSDGLNN
ncbi:MAG: class 3 adenylate cyclase/mono/diheme cytochrome c family protein [Gammaproteobacteria bacterium]|jgi:class 3 adenylate cyclase/mono/diheme cytochrome c family protein